jgi:hypothetical protein
MACKRYQGALSDLAAGGPAAADVEAHLQSCEACRAELLALRQALAAADEELARLLRVEPSPELAVRLRAVLAEPEASRSWRFGWLWPAAGVGAAFLVALALLTTRDRSPRAASPLTTGSGAAVGSGPAGAASAHATPPGSLGDREEPRSPLGTAMVSSSASPTRVAHASEPTPLPVSDLSPSSVTGATRLIKAEVLVPPGQEDALVRFAVDLQRRQVELGSLLVADVEAPLPEPGDIDLTLLDTRPLDTAPLDHSSPSDT